MSTTICKPFTIKIRCLFFKSIKEWLLAKKERPQPNGTSLFSSKSLISRTRQFIINGTSLSSSIYKTTKSTRNTKLWTFINISSIIPLDFLTDPSANCKILSIFLMVPKPNLCLVVVIYLTKISSKFFFFYCNWKARRGCFTWFSWFHEKFGWFFHLGLFVTYAKLWHVYGLSYKLNKRGNCLACWGLIRCKINRHPCFWNESLLIINCWTFFYETIL